MAPLILVLTLCLSTLVACAVVQRDAATDAMNIFETPSNVSTTHHVKRASKNKHRKMSTSKYLRSLGVNCFLGVNGPAIGSWFRTVGDSTNGHSWCGYPYHDSDPLFAPDVTMMLNDHGGDYQKAAKAYCGLEAIVKTPEGNSMTLYIGDGFDHRWVRSPGSIDITVTTFGKLYKPTYNKDVVIKGVEWHLTGNRSKKFCFRCRGNN